MARQIFIKLAFRSLRRNLRRTLITLTAVAIGLAGLIFLRGYVDGTNQQMIQNVTGYLSGHVQIHQRGYHDDPTLDLTFHGSSAVEGKVKSEPSVAAVAPRVEGEALASGAEKTRGVLVIGVDPRYEQAVTTLVRAVRQGSYLDNADPNGIVLGKKVAEVLRVQVGDDVTLVTQAADGSIGAGRYRLRGIYESGIEMIDGTYALLTLGAAQQLYALEGRITTLALRLHDIDAAGRTVRALDKALGADFEALNWRELMPGTAADVDFHDMLTQIILFVVFVIVLLGIANTVLMGVLERTRELGVMLALGTRRGQLARVVFYEAFLLGVIGIAVGVAIGMAFVAYFGERGIDLTRYSQAMQMMPGLTGIVYTSVRATEIFWLGGLVLFATLLASTYPAIKAAGLTPIEAIRGARQALLRGHRLWRRRILPARAVLLHIALRGLARNPRRAALTLSALGAGLAAYLFLDALGQGFFLQMRDNSTALLTGHLQFEMKTFRDELDAKLTLAGTDSLLQRTRANRYVAAAAPRLQAQAMISSPTQSEPVMVYGVDPEAETKVTRLHEKIGEGAYLSTNRNRDSHQLTLSLRERVKGEGRVEENLPSPQSPLPEGEGVEPSALRATSYDRREIVIGQKLAERLGVRLGEKVVVMAPAADGSLGSAALRIVGILATDNDILDRAIALTSLATARELLGVRRDATTIAVRLHDIDATDAAVASLARELTAADQQVIPWNVLVPEIVQLLELIQVNLRVILIVVFIVVVLGVANTLLMAVFERTREFGLQLALGTRPGQIVRTVLYESLMLGTCGLAVGMIMGTAVVGYFNYAGFDLSEYAAGLTAGPGMTTVVHPTLVLQNLWLPLSALLVTSVLAALYPAWRAARLEPVQALRHV